MSQRVTVEEQHPSGDGNGEDGGSAAAEEGQPPGQQPDGGRPRAWWERSWVVVGGLTLLVAVVPLVVALVAMSGQRWFPQLDLAQTEMRVRDVWSSNRPLIGLPGRFNTDVGPGGFEDWQGSHLGPLSFYALWPVYTLFGGSAWALQVAAAALNILAAGTAIWIAQRRGGPMVALGLAGGLALLMSSYGPTWLTEAWNPYMPMLWWLVFLLAVWSVLCDDLAVLPVAVFAGSLCMQTHIPYMGLVGAVGGFAVGVVLLTVLIRWRRRQFSGPEARRLAAWSGGSLGLLALLWAPPVYEQLTRSPGNMTIVGESLTDPNAAPRPAGGDVVSIWFGLLDLRALMPSYDDLATSRAILPGLVLLAAWLAAGGWVASRWFLARGGRGTYDTTLLKLWAVTAVAMVVGAVSISQVRGEIWYYLFLWGRATTVLMLVVVGWAAADAWRARPATSDRADVGGQRRFQPLALGLLGAVTLVTAGFTVDAATATIPTERGSQTLEVLAPLTAEALRAGEIPGTGENGRYLQWWIWPDSDEQGLGDQAQGLLIELEKRGFEMGAPAHHAGGVAPHRVISPEDATATIHYVVGPCIIERWRATPDATLVAEYDPRTAAELDRASSLVETLRRELRTRAEQATDPGEAEALDSLAQHTHQSLFAVQLSDDLPDDLQPLADELMDLGFPAAVFIAPPDVVTPAIEDC